MLRPPCPLSLRLHLICMCHIDPPVNLSNISVICVPEQCQNGDIAEQKLNRPTTEKLPADGKCGPCLSQAFDCLCLIEHRSVGGNTKVPMLRSSFLFKAFSVTRKGAVQNQV